MNNNQIPEDSEINIMNNNNDNSPKDRTTKKIYNSSKNQPNIINKEPIQFNPNKTLPNKKYQNIN